MLWKCPSQHKTKIHWSIIIPLFYGDWLYRVGFCLSKWSSQWKKHSWQWLGAEPGRLQWRDNSNQIWYHQVFYAKGIPFPTPTFLLPCRMPGPTSGCLALALSHTFRHWKPHYLQWQHRFNRRRVGKKQVLETTVWWPERFSFFFLRRRRGDRVSFKPWSTNWEALNIQNVARRSIRAWMYLPRGDSLSA